MNVYTLAAKMNRQINKKAMEFEKMNICNTYNECIEKAKELALNEFDNNMKLACELQLRWKRIANEMGINDDTKLKQHYFITVRPDTNEITIDKFIEKIANFVSRKCFISYVLSFEQKGICNEDIGKGFHVHILAHMSQRSKGEVLRDTISSFKDCTSANCIQVDILKTKNDYDSSYKYIAEYESNDDHKIVTKEWDEIWRQKINIEHLYTHPPSIKSMTAGENSLRIEFM